MFVTGTLANTDWGAFKLIRRTLYFVKIIEHVLNAVQSVPSKSSFPLRCPIPSLMPDYSSVRTSTPDLEALFLAPLVPFSSSSTLTLTSPLCSRAFGKDHFFFSLSMLPGKNAALKSRKIGSRWRFLSLPVNNIPDSEKKREKRKIDHTNYITY